MPAMLTREGQQVEVADWREAKDRFLAGELGFVPGTVIPVKSKGGQFGDLPAEQAEGYFSTGDFDVETPEERAERIKQETYGTTGQQFLTGLEGAASGATFGVSRHLETAFGVDPEAMAARAEVNPGIATATEIGGAVAPILLSGGTGAVGAAARLAPTARLARGTAAIERGVAGLVGEAAAGERLASALVRKAAPAVARETVEGLAYGAGQVIDETALGDPTMTAEKAMATIGLSGLLGGSLGGTLAVGGLLATRQIEKARGALERYGAKRAAGEVAEEVSETPITDALSSSQATASPAAKATAEAVAEAPDVTVNASFDGPTVNLGGGLNDPAQAHLRRVAVRKKYDQETVVKGYRALEEIDDRMERTLSQVEGSGKPELMERLMRQEGVSPEAAKRQALSFLDRTRNELLAMRRDRLHYTETGAIAAVLEGVERATKEIKSTRSAWGVSTRIDDLKKLIGDKAGYGRILKEIEVGHAETYTRMRGFYDRFRGHLEDQSLYGNAASVYAKINDASYQYRKLRDESFDRFFTMKKGDRRAVDFTKYHTYINKQAGTNELTHVDERALDRLISLEDYLKHSENYLDTVEALQKEFQGVPLDVKGVREAAKKAKVTNASIRQKASAIRQYKDLAEEAAAEAALSPQLPGRLGSVQAAITAPINLAVNVRNFVKASASSGADAAAQAAATANASAAARLTQIRHLAIWEQMQIKTARHIQRVADAMAAGEAKAAQLAKARTGLLAGTGSQVLLGVDYGGRAEEQKPKDIYEAYQRHAQSLATLAGSPEAVGQRVSERLGTFSDAAPSVAAKLGETATRGIGYLAAELPRSPLTPRFPRKAHGKWVPPESELAAFARKVRAVEDPLSVFEDLAAGEVSLEAATAVRTVYPGLFAMMREQVEASLAGAEEPPAYERVKTLSLFFGEPLDPTLEPDFVRAMQAGPTPEQERAQAESAGMPRATGGKLKSIDSARSATERIANR